MIRYFQKILKWSVLRGASFGLLAMLATSFVNAEAIPEALLGDWAVELDSGKPAWMSLVEEEGQPLVYFRVYVGSHGPHRVTGIEDGRLEFSIGNPKRKKPGAADAQRVSVGLLEGKLDGVILRSYADGRVERDAFTGKKVPGMPSAPDLSKVRFGKPVSLFNGKDLTGWRLYESDKLNGWGVEDGVMVNNTPKTDFSATGSYANIRTVAEFEDFWLHIEFLVEEKRNSGIYLRGTYEAQVVDRDSRMQGLQGVGAIFSRIAPSVNAGKKGGEWQTYDITLVDRHVTVVLNGVKVIDNQALVGPTAGAINTDPMAAGPIYLQGDHTTVKYKDIYLAPVIKD